MRWFKADLRWTHHITKYYTDKGKPPVLLANVPLLFGSIAFTFSASTYLSIHLSTYLSIYYSSLVNLISWLSLSSYKDIHSTHENKFNYYFINIFFNFFYFQFALKALPHELSQIWNFNSIKSPNWQGKFICRIFVYFSFFISKKTNKIHFIYVELKRLFVICYGCSMFEQK